MLLLEERVETPLGSVLVHVEGGAGRMAAHACEARPRVPEGMSVDGVAALEVAFVSSVSPADGVVVRGRFDGAGSPETGEWLESICFTHALGQLNIGFRDREWLERKGVLVDWADYRSDSISVRVQAAPAGASFPICIAWRLSPIPEDDASTWFAVDLALPN